MARELATLIEAHTAHDGILPTTVPNLYLYRYTSPSICARGIVSPSLSVVAQGSKRVIFGEESYPQAADQYMVTSVDLPLTGHVVKASRAVPYFALRYDLDIEQLKAIIAEGNMGIVRKSLPERGLYVTRITSELEDALTRVMRLLKNPEDIPVLAPLLNQEILYRLIRDGHGAILRKIAQAESRTHQVARIIHWMKRNVDRPLSKAAVAKEANMSSSVLHEQFKKVTQMSPMQFHKQLRLQEARRQLLAGGSDAASAALGVGYKSPSQFSREYARLFGIPPLRDARQFHQRLSIEGD